MHQSIPPAPSPPPRATAGICQPCQSRGWGICKFCTAWGPDICQPPGYSRAFWRPRGFLSECNYTEDFAGKKKKKNILALLSRTGINCRGLERHVLDFTCLCAFLHYLSSHNYFAKLEVSIWINVFWFILNQISVDIIWRRSFHIYKTIHNI